MTEKVKNIIAYCSILLIVFCLAFMSSYYLLIKPRYKYIDEKNIYEEIKGLKEEVMARDAKIVELERELEAYRAMAEAADGGIVLDE